MRHPARSAVFSGENATFEIEVDEKAETLYQWHRNHVPIAQANQSVYILQDVTMADDGALFYCTVTNQYGSVQSEAARLTVLTSNEDDVIYRAYLPLVQSTTN